MDEKHRLFFKVDRAAVLFDDDRVKLPSAFDRREPR